MTVLKSSRKPKAEYCTGALEKKERNSTSTDWPQKLDLKPLPLELKYAYLEKHE